MIETAALAHNDIKMPANQTLFPSTFSGVLLDRARDFMVF